MAVGSTAVWRLRTGGNNLNGGGYDAGISGAGTDYSQQDAAQASGSNGSCPNTTTFVDATANAFTSAMVGNAIWIASGGGNTGPYFVTGYTSASTVTIDRAPGTVTTGAWKLGGAWGNGTNGESNLVAGNTVYIRASGSGSAASPDYSFSGIPFAFTAGSYTIGMVHIIGENGMPFIANNGNQMAYSCSGFVFSNLYFIGCNQVLNNVNSWVATNCIFDQHGTDNTMACGTGTLIGCEIFSSIANGGAAGTGYAISQAGGSFLNIIDCNIHDCWGHGVSLVTNSTDSGNILNSIVAKCAGNGITLQNALPTPGVSVWNCTIDGNKGHGIVFNDANTLLGSCVINNIISNHTQAGKYGIYCNFNTQSINDRVRLQVDYNCYYNNTGHAFNLTVGTTVINGLALHDSVGVDPQYTSQSTQNYAIGTNLRGLTQAMPPVTGGATSVTYLSPGAVQPTASGGGTTTYVINKITTMYLQGDDYGAPL